MADPTTRHPPRLSVLLALLASAACARVPSPDLSRDPAALLAQVRERGGDAMAGSVVLGDVAYEVEPGFLAEASAVEAASRMTAPARGPAGPGGGTALPGDLEDRRQAAEALARFLLDNLS